MLVSPPTQPLKKEDPVARQMAKPDACAKPCSMGGAKSVRVRPMNMSDKVKIRKKRKHWDRRDVAFY